MLATDSAEIQRRLRELQEGDHSDKPLDQIERFGLRMLDRMGYETLQACNNVSDPIRYEVWTYETLVWTARRCRAGEWKEALRGWGQAREYYALARTVRHAAEESLTGRTHPCVAGTLDQIHAIQNYLERNAFL
jgi:hypothetical protein